MWRRERVEVFMADESSRLQTIEWNALDVCMSSTANSIASCARLLRNSARKSGVPSSRAITASPSIRNDDALRRRAASTMAGNSAHANIVVMDKGPDQILIVGDSLLAYSRWYFMSRRIPHWENRA